MTSTKTHFDSIDFLRGIAALSVCLFHFATNYLPETHLFAYLFKEGHLGVEIFFVITAFLVPYSLARKGYTLVSFPKYMLDRVLRLQPAYMVAILICVFQEYIGALFFNAPFWVTTKDVIAHFFYLPPHIGTKWLLIAFWTLMIQFQFYIVFALLYPLFLHKQKIIRILMLLAGMMLNWIFKDKLYENHLIYYFIIFIPGILIYLRSHQWLENWEYWVLLIIDCYLLYEQRGAVLRPCAVIFASIVIQFININHAYWKWLGTNSYALYLIHLPVGGALLGFVKLQTNDVLLLSVAFVGAVLLSLGAAHLFYRWVEAPSQVWAKNILDRF